MVPIIIPIITAKKAINAGVDVLVSGSYLFNNEIPMKQLIKNLKK